MSIKPVWRVRARAAAAFVAASLSLLVLAANASAAGEVVNETFPVSVDAGGEFAAAKVESSVSISADGRYVAFESAAENLAGEPLTGYEAFVKNLETGEVVLASRANGVDGAPAEEPALEPCNPGATLVHGTKISADGRYVLFESIADNLVGGLPLEAEEDEEECGSTHVYRRDLETGETVLVDRANGIPGVTVGREAAADAISADGRYVLFTDEVDDLEDPAGEHEWGSVGKVVYLRDLEAGTTTLVGRASGAEGAAANRPAEGRFIAADDSFAIFSSGASNLASNIGSNTHLQLYLRELEAPYRTILLSQNGDEEAGDGNSSTAAVVGGDDCQVAFGSAATDLGADSPAGQTFLRDWCSTPPTTGVVGLGAEGEEFEVAELLGADDLGRVAFKGSPEAGAEHLYLRDLASGEVEVLDRASGADGELGNVGVGAAAISADGCRVAFTDEATNLTATAPPVGAARQVYARNLPCAAEEGREERSTGGGSSAGGGGSTAGSDAGGTGITAATTVRVGRLGRATLWLSFDGAGRSRIRIQRQTTGRDRGWRQVKALIATATGSGAVKVLLPRLAPGRYRLKLRLQGDPDNPTLTRLLEVGGRR